MSEITVVTFDLWQTLLLDNRELGRARALIRLEGAQKHLREFGEEYELEHIREAYRACYRRCHDIRDELLDVSFQEQVEIFINLIDEGLVDRLDRETVHSIEKIYADSFLMQPPIPHIDALAVLRNVKEMGLRVGLISNTGMTPGATFRDYLSQQGMLEYFDVLTFSDEVRISKPAPEIFLMTLESLKAKPSESIHVGDHVQNDVAGAKAAGLKTVWITGFYEREDLSDPRTEPDITVDGLGGVSEAVARLSGRDLAA